MKSKRVQVVVLGVVLAALAGWVLRSTLQPSSLPSEEASRLVRGADLDDDSLIEDTSTVERERPAQSAAQNPSRLAGADDEANETPSESADENKQKRKTRRDRSKRGGPKTAEDSDRDDTPAATPQGPKVRISGNRAKKGGP